ncbi:MAG TPA: cyclase family protein [Euzebyales bacterium]
MTTPTTAVPDGVPAIHDISAPLRPELVTWPGVVERFARTEVASFAAGDAMRVSHLQLGAHAGTHIDAPSHFLPDGGGIETLPLDALIGPAQVIDVPRDVRLITADVLAAARIPSDAARLLARTANSGWSAHATTFDEQYVALDAGAARWCIDRGIRLVGIDYLSVEPFDADTRDYPVHKALLGAGVVVLESLDLADVVAGPYELTVLPLLIPGSDGSPARALLRAP